MSINKSYPSKLLLLGEYGILLGSAGLALPYPAFTGSFCFGIEPPDPDHTKASIESNRHLKSLSGYINSSPEIFDFIDRESFDGDINKGLWFNSNIPQGYGVGSSGALTAAIFDRYAPENIKNLPLPEIRNKLASIEKYFHGTSSGLDPLVSYINRPIFIENPDRISIPDLSFFTADPEHSQTGLFLVDTGIISQTGTLVHWFLDQYQDFEFRRAVNEVYFPVIDQAIEALLHNNSLIFRMAFEAITGFQMQFLNPLIPEPMMEHLEYGLFSGQFFLKLCGSGGGGFMLGVTGEPGKTENYFGEKGFTIRFL